MLDEVKQKMVEVAKMTAELVLLDHKRAAEHMTEGQTKELAVVGLIQNAKNLAASLTTSAQLPAGGGGQDGARSNHLLYEKRPFPRFDGKKRNFPSFKREWSDTVTGKYPPDFELRQIRECTPKEIQPDIKNLKLLAEVWKVLNEEYGQVMELTSELIDMLSLPSSTGSGPRCLLT